MLGLLPLCVAPLGFSTVIDPDQADLITTLLLAQDSREFALEGLDTRAMYMVALDRRKFTLPEGTKISTVPTVIDIYVDGDDEAYEDDGTDIYIGD